MLLQFSNRWFLLRLVPFALFSSRVPLFGLISGPSAFFALWPFVIAIYKPGHRFECDVYSFL